MRMIAIRVALLLTLAVGGATSYSQPAQAPSDSGHDKPLASRPGYKLVTVLSDEFNGAEVDRNKWLDHISYFIIADGSHCGPCRPAVARI